MEHIKNIEIKNFKSIRHQKIEGCKRINVFVGPPNVGKSNVLEALGGFSCLLESNNVVLNELIRFREAPDLFFNGNSEILAEACINERFFIDFRFKSINSFEVTIANKSLEFEGTVQYLSAKQLYNSSVVDGVHKTTSVNAVYVKEAIGSWIDNQHLTHIKKYDYKRDVGYSVSTDKSLVVPFGNNINDVVELNRKLRSEIAILFNANQQKLLFDKAKKDLRVVRFLDDGTIFSLSVDLVADTLKRLIFYKAAIYSNENSVLLFEEPEAHCYEPYIIEITNAIKNDTNNNQFFIVTHSQYVIDELLRDKESRDATNIYLVGLENSETVIKLLDEETSKDVYEQGLNVFFNFSSLWEETEKV